MIAKRIVRVSVLALACTSLAACGGGDGSSAPATATPTPSATASPAPSPAPSPTPTPAPTATAQQISNDIQYGQGATTTGDIPLRFDLYQPDEPCTANRPTVFFVHGGGFTSGNKRDQNSRTISEKMTARGINFISIQYRLQPNDPVPSQQYRAIVDDIIADIGGDTEEPRIDSIAAAFEDAVTALNFIEANQDALCVDASRLGFWGSSAGATTVMQVAYGLNQFGIQRPEPRVVVDYWGNLLRDSDVGIGEAPFFVVHGTLDNTSPYQNALDLTGQADIVAIQYALYTVIGARHGFANTGVFENTFEGVVLADLTADFVEAHLTGGMPVYGRFEVTP